MDSKLLKLESAPLKFKLLLDCPPYRRKIGDLTIREVYVPPSNGKGEFGLYQVVIEGLVETRSQLTEKYTEAVSLAENIAKLWSYVLTTPLHGNTFGRALAFISPPKGWTANNDEIRKELDTKEFGITFKSVSIGRIEWNRANQLPLERAVRIWSKYQEADQIIKTLIDFHFEALSSYSTHSCLFLLSKGLEITRGHMPGKTDIERQSSLPPEVQRNLKNSYHDLFDLSNNRLNTRHAIKSKSVPVELHPELLEKELVDFIHDCDLIIRAVVCQYFQEEVVIPLQDLKHEAK